MEPPVQPFAVFSLLSVFFHHVRFIHDRKKMKSMKMKGVIACMFIYDLRTHVQLFSSSDSVCVWGWAGVGLSGVDGLAVDA